MITNGTIGKEICANGLNGNAVGTNGTNVTNQLGEPLNTNIIFSHSAIALTVSLDLSWQLFRGWVSKSFQMLHEIRGHALFT